MSGAEGWFVAGASVVMAAGGGHALASVFDLVRPTFFGPVDQALVQEMRRTTFRFRNLWPGSDDVHPTMWNLWLGFNISHGLGVFTFGLVCLLLAAHDFTLVGSIGALRPVTIAFPAAYLLLSLRFWFYVPALATAAATACFAVSAILAG